MSEKLYKVADDFEAEIRIFREDEEGRVSAPFNGIRWDFAYDGDDISKSGIFMVWPDFLDAEGNSLSTHLPLAVDETLLARMTIVVDEIREKIHRKRIHKDVRFYCHEGGKRVAEGIVTKVTGLFNDR